MPINKSQTARYYIIDECLRNRIKNHWSKRELLEKINISTDFPIEERTLDYDIQNLRQSDQLKYYAPIKYSKKHNGYYYEDPNYSIRLLALNSIDIDALEFATSILNQYKEINMFQDFAGAVDKILNVVSLIKNKNSDFEFNFIDIEKAPYCKGNTFLDSLVAMIRQQQVVEIVYKKFTSNEEKKHVLHPYLLKEYRNRWYLLGWDHDKLRITTLGLDRMIEVKPIDLCFITPEKFNPDLYFKNTVGLTYIDKPVEKIVLSFQSLQGHYLKTQPLHETQEILKDDETGFVIQVDLIPNYELKERILGYGPFVKVLHPESYRAEIAQSIAEMNSLYTSRDNSM